MCAHRQDIKHRLLDSCQKSLLKAGHLRQALEAIGLRQAEGQEEIGHGDIYRLQEELVRGHVQLEGHSAPKASCAVFPQDFRSLLGKVETDSGDSVLMDYYRFRQHFIHLKVARLLSLQQSGTE